MTKFINHLNRKGTIAILSILALCTLIALSCKKDKNSNNDNNNLPFSNTIKGVILRDMEAEPAGQLGTPDNNVPVSNDSFMMIFPTPAESSMNVAYKITNNVPGTAVITLYNALYPTAPSSYYFYGINDTVNTVIENASLAGTVAMTDTVNIPTGNDSHIATLNVSSLPQGFYRVYIQFSNGQAFWDNTWILRH